MALLERGALTYSLILKLRNPPLLKVAGYKFLRETARQGLYKGVSFGHDNP